MVKAIFYLKKGSFEKKNVIHQEAATRMTEILGSLDSDNL